MYDTISREAVTNLCSGMGKEAKTLELLCERIGRSFPGPATVFLFRAFNDELKIAVDDEPDVRWDSIKESKRIIGTYPPAELPEILLLYARML